MVKDLQGRSLGEQATTAESVLQEPLGTVKRAIEAELLSRALYLFRWNQAHPVLSLEDTFLSLAERCVRYITELSIDEGFLTRNKLPEDASQGQTSWVDVFLQHYVEGDQLRIDSRQDHGTI